MTNLTDREAALIAKKMLGFFNEPKATRDIPLSHEALTLVTLPSGEVVTLFGFAHERQVATVVRKHLRDIAPVSVKHVVAKRGTREVTETRGSFIDLENGVSRRAV